MLIIDPQVDFCDPDLGALFVPGADSDMDRLAHWVSEHIDEIQQIDVSLDSHHLVDIAHPAWWTDARGESPAPFTPITARDVRAGRWLCRDPERTTRTLDYLDALSVRGRFTHLIWPPHCLIGTPGHNIWPPLAAALHRWELHHGRPVHFLHKGANVWTEHFSAVGAEVPDPEVPGDKAAADWLTSIVSSRRLVVAGEALSHCVGNTVIDLLSHAPGLAERMTLLTDATSPVGGFEEQGAKLLTALQSGGVTLARCAPPA